MLVEWARNARIIKSGGSAGMMTVVSFCHLFVYFATSATPKTTEENKPYTIARLSAWMESISESSCGKLIFDFLKMLGSHRNKEWLASRVDPVNFEKLIESDSIKDLARHAEIAIYILAVYGGNVDKLFEFCTNKRIFRLHKLFMDPGSTTKEVCKQTLKHIKIKCESGKRGHLEFVLLERNGVYYLEVTGDDHKHFQHVEREINKIQNNVLSVRFNGVKTDKSYHIAEATMIIPECGVGESTEVSFSMYEGGNFQAHVSLKS